MDENQQPADLDLYCFQKTPDGIEFLKSYAHHPFYLVELGYIMLQV